MAMKPLGMNRRHRKAHARLERGVDISHIESDVARERYFFEDWKLRVATFEADTMRSLTCDAHASLWRRTSSQ